MANLERIAASAVAAGLILASCGGGGVAKTAGSTTTATPTSSSATTAPVTPSALLLGGTDLPGYSTVSQPGATPIPCGSHFGDTSTSTTQAAVAFATAGSQQAVSETVALYPSPAAATVIAAGFRRAGVSCAQFDDTKGPTTTYQVRVLTAPAVTAADVVGVALASPAHFYDLILLRSGARLAWLALSQIGNPVDPAVLTSVASAAAAHLGS